MKQLANLVLSLAVSGSVILGMESGVDFSARRRELLARVHEVHMDDSGPILLLADYESGITRFRQESSFYYLTGVELPGTALLIAPEGTTTLFVPNQGAERAVWTNSLLMPTPENAKRLGVDTLAVLGQEGQDCHPLAARGAYEQLLARLGDFSDGTRRLFTLCSVPNYLMQRLLLDRLDSFAPGLAEACVDISPIIAHMRRRKDEGEVALIRRAIKNTVHAQRAAAWAIGDGVREAEVQACLEYVMIRAGMRPCFPSIVASGRNGTVLHYDDNTDVMRAGELVVVDIGAACGHYCADISRTYPVSGRFTARQRELYDVVLQTQEHVARLAGPGMWLVNKQDPTVSLHHHAQDFLDRAGYGHYFPHAIGHSLGLDDHDAGDRQSSLHEGDVMTIEPGVYIPDEEIGIRIEDDYVIGPDGAICLSQQLPKEPGEVEALMRKTVLE